MASPKKKLVYGMLWPITMEQLAIEFSMIKRGGTIFRESDQATVGNGLFWHWQKAKTLIWPEFKIHRWDELRTKCFLEYEYIGEMGCAAAGKSQSAACNFLLDWYIWSSCTTVLVTSTDIPSLELRVWGMMKSYHRVAKENYPWLPGYLIEGKRMITLDPRSDCEEGRDFRNGCIAIPVKKGSAWVGLGSMVGIHNKRVRLLADECFVAGTMVDTLNGPVAIENIRVGDKILNAQGIGRVIATSDRISRDLVTVHIKDKVHITCTPNHPFLTQFGWKKAFELDERCFILSTNDAVRILRKPTQQGKTTKTVLQPFVPFQMESHQARRRAEMCEKNTSTQNLRVLPWTDAKRAQAFLQSVLQFEMGAQSTGNSIQPEPKTFDSEKGFLEIPSRFYEGVEQKATWSSLDTGSQRKTFHDYEGTRALSSNSRWKRDRTNKGREKIIGDESGVFVELQDQDREMERQWLSDCLQSRCCASRFKTCNRSGRFFPQQPKPKAERREERYIFEGAWVERVEIHQQPNTELSRFNEGGYRVYNLQIDSHPSYSVNGFLVHNCNLMPKVFLDSTANLSKAEDFKLCGLGNPNETTNAHGLLCEPAMDLGGWDGGIDQTPKTKTWKTRFPNGICIQTPGNDSPNLDDPPGAPPRFPFLITREQIDHDAQIWGRDDWHFTMMVDGKMPRGQGSRRVITRAMCERGRALEEPIWRDSRRTRIAALDSAFRGVGGDRCVYCEMQFGYEAEPLPGPDKFVFPLANQEPNAKGERQIIALIDMLVIPINAEKGAPEPEDQIVAFVKRECENRGIPPENFFYDAAMRTSLVTAFARLWSAQVNSIDSMGKPDDREVSANIDVKCCDYYSKRVTQFWYDTRHCIEAQQLRGLTQECMLEGCIREFKQVASNKIEVESKEDMKVKSGRSPDLFDCLCYCLYGAMQRGFVISKIGAIRERMNPTREVWKTNARIRARELWHAHDLNYSA